MKHYHAHILELYVLGAPEVSGDVATITAHLEVCEGCRDMVQEISRFYDDLGEEMKNERVSGEGNALVPYRSSDSLQRSEQSMSPVSPDHQISGLPQIRRLIKRHPIKISIGTLGIAAGLTFALIMRNPVDPEKSNPEHKFYNTASGSVDILNRYDSTIFRFRAQDLGSIHENEQDVGVERLLIDDLDQDGRSEVVSVIQPLSSLNHRGGRVFVYGFNKEVVRAETINVADRIDYENWDDAPDFNPNALVVRLNRVSNEKEVFVLAQHYRASPSVLLRLNARREVIGRYWHFGHLTSMKLMDLDGDGASELLLSGVNDVYETTTGSFSVLIRIDPEKLIGEQRSSTAPRFKVPTCTAEMDYIRLPNSELNRVFHQVGVANQLQMEGGGRLSVRVDTKSFQDGHFDIHFIFDYALRAVRVRSNGALDGYLQTLKEKGYAVEPMDEKYLSRLRGMVEYWDGTSWRSSPIPINVAQKVTIH